MIPPTFRTLQIGALEWQVDLPQPMPWGHAVEYARMMDSAFGGGWRLPTVQELVGLWDYSAVCCEAFPNDRGWFWTSSRPPTHNIAWCVDFKDGFVSSDSQFNNCFVRLVRTL